jgi:tetratricopeptide (TPR) repeat protein
MKNKNAITFFMCLMLLVSFSTFAQLNTPRGSQQATVSQRVGTSDVSITYSRPSVNDREVWGKLVPYGMNNLGFGTATAAPWRAGANENSTITFSHDAKVEGKDIKAGTYGLHINVKDANNATIILSHDTNSWGSFFYDASKDALTADVTMKDAAHKELLTFEFNTVDATSAIASLVWEKKEIPFKIEFDVTDIVLADFRDKSKGNLGFNRQNWEQAANFALNNGGDLDEALGWVDGAITGQFYSQKTFNNLALKSRILKKMGKADEASSLLAEAASLANTNQLNTLGYQMINAKDYDNALKYFKLNVANNPENANVHDSLGECYKIMGDKKNAVKYLKKSLSLNPPANVKANSEKLLGELGESI